MKRGPGRTPSSAALKLVKGLKDVPTGKRVGTPRPQNTKAPAERPKRKPPAAPKHLTPAAKQYWKKIAKVVVEMRVLGESDLMALEQLCETYSLWRQAADDVEKDGYTAFGKFGETQSVAAKTMDQASRRLQSLLGEFGLTPSARPRATVTDD